MLFVFIQESILNAFDGRGKSSEGNMCGHERIVDPEGFDESCEHLLSHRKPLFRVTDTCWPGVLFHGVSAMRAQYAVSRFRWILGVSAFKARPGKF